MVFNSSDPAAAVSYPEPLPQCYHCYNCYTPSLSPPPFSTVVTHLPDPQQHAEFTPACFPSSQSFAPNHGLHQPRFTPRHVLHQPPATRLHQTHLAHFKTNHHPHQTTVYTNHRLHLHQPTFTPNRGLHRLH